MLKALATNKEGKPVLVMGLSENNLQALRAGRPIRISDPKYFDGDIIIFYGATEQDMQKMFEPFVGPETKIHIDPKLK